MGLCHVNKAGRVIHMHTFKCLSSKLLLGDFSTAVGIHTEYVIVPKSVRCFGGSGMFCCFVIAGVLCPLGRYTIE